MHASRSRLALIVCSLILAIGVQACERGGNGRSRLLAGSESLTGRWSAVSAVAVDGCGLSASVSPLGFPFCDITQSGDTLRMTCGDWCGGQCTNALGTIQGDGITLASERTIDLGAGCSVRVAETDAATLAGGTLSGEATMMVTLVGNCAGQFPCLMKGPVNLTRFQYAPGVVYPACVMVCQ